MNKITKNIAALIAFGSTTIGFAQVTQQKIGINPTLINSNAALEIESTAKGLLMPRIALAATDSFAPLTAHVAGMTVYNTGTSAASVPDGNKVTPGYYYNDGTQWVRVATGADAKTEPWRQQATTNEATANGQNIYQTGSVAVGDFSTAASTKKMEVKGNFKAEVSTGGNAYGMEIDHPLIPGVQTSANYWLGSAGNYRVNLVHSAAGVLSAGLIGAGGHESIISVDDNRVTLGSRLNSLISKSEMRTEKTGNFFLEAYNNNNALDYAATVSLQDDGLRMVHSTTDGDGLNWLAQSNRSEIMVQKANGVRFNFRNGSGTQTGEYWFPLTTGNAGQVMTQTSTGKMTWSTPAVEPWNVMGSPAGTQATSNTQNIFQTGNVSIGGSNNTGKLNVINTAGTANSLDFTMVANRAAGVTTNPATLNFYSNLGTGSFSTLSVAGDKALIFSADGDASVDSTNGFLIAPHVNGGKPYGFKITEQGKATINAATPTETFDINGTTRVRDLPTSGAANAIYNGTETKATTFTGTRTVVADANGVLGTVVGLPVASVLANNGLTKNVTTNEIELGGSLNRATDITLNTRQLSIIGSTQRTNYSPNGILVQEGITSHGSMIVRSADVNSNSRQTNLYLQAFDGSSTQILAGEDATSLTIGTTNTAVLAPIIFSTNHAVSTLHSEKMRLTPSGQLAIGVNTVPTITAGSETINPKLHVAGDISTTGKVWTTNSVYADYVFEKYFKGSSDINPNYEFKSLNYVKDFIKANHHLPGVESIADLAKADNGYTFDITKLTVQSLEKIEELYLHTIEQQGKIDAQQAEIDQLKKEAENTQLRLEKLEKLLLKD